MDELNDDDDDNDDCSCWRDALHQCISLRPVQSDLDEI